MKPGLAILLCAMFLSSCAPALYYQPAKTQPDVSKVVYARGVPALRTTVQGCEVVAELSSKGEKDMSLNLYIRNNGDSAFTFEPGQVEVHGYNMMGQKKPYRVFTAEEYIHWKNTRDAIIAGVAIVATVATVAIIANNTKGSDSKAGNANYYASENGAEVFVDVLNLAYDISWWMAWTIPDNVDEMPSPPESSPDFLLREHTLYPGDAVQGIVKLRADAGYKNKILVEVPVNGVYTRFVFDRSKHVH